MGLGVIVELDVARQQFVHPIFERFKLGVRHGFAIAWSAPIVDGRALPTNTRDSPIANLESRLRYSRCKLRRKLLMAGLRLVYSPPCNRVEFRENRLSSGA